MNKTIIILILTMGLAACNSGFNTVGVEEFEKGLNTDVILLDVRTDGEYAQGHLENAVNLNVHDPKFTENVQKLSKDKPVYVYCQSGRRSADAADQLTSMGYKVVNLEGGIMDWVAESKPLEGVPERPVTKYSLDTYNAFIAEHDLILVDFYADWCGPCRAMAPHIESVKADNPDKLTIMKVNTDESQAIARHFNITGIPRVKLYKGGEEVYDRVGYHSKEQLLQALEPYL